MKHRFLSFVIALIFVVSLLPATASASNLDTSWYDNNKSATEYHLTDADDFYGFKYLIEKTTDFSGKTIYIDYDIDMSAYSTFSGCGSRTKPFKGIFNGQGHTISNITLTGNGDREGLFGQTDGAQIINVKVSGNVNVSGDLNSNGDVGGIVGYAANTTIENCSFTGKVSGDQSCYFGGIVGCANNSKIINCSTDITVSDMNSGSCMGGIVEVAFGNSVVDGCISKGSMTGSKNTGGIAALIQSGTKVINCISYQTLTLSAGSYTGDNPPIYGGVVASNYATCNIENCCFAGKIESHSTTAVPVGGIVGENREYVKNCYNCGTVTIVENTGSKAGSIAGTNTSTSAVSDCYSETSVGSGTNGTVIDNEKMTAACGTDGALVDKLNSWIEQQENKSEFSHWAQDSKINNGYPAFGIPVTLDYNDGSGKTATAYALPGGHLTAGNLNIGYSIATWYRNKACNTAWNLADDTVTSGLTLYAKWKMPDEPTVSEKDNKVTYSVTLGKRVTSDDPLKVIFAQYKDGKLVSMNIREINESSGCKIEQEFDTEDGKTYKIFLIGSTFTPVCAAGAAS